jgi:hypothetical protein
MNDGGSIFTYSISGALMIDAIMPFLNGLDAHAGAIGAILATATFIMNRFDKRKKHVCK